MQSLFGSLALPAWPSAFISDIASQVLIFHFEPTVGARCDEAVDIVKSALDDSKGTAIVVTQPVLLVRFVVAVLLGFPWLPCKGPVPSQGGALAMTPKTDTFSVSDHGAV